MAPGTATEPAAWGIDASYRDAFDRPQAVSPATQQAVLAAMGGARDAAPPPSPVRIVRRGAPLPARGELILEDGTELGHLDRLPPDVPYGYHRLQTEAGALTLIAGPGRCHLPTGLRSWGWAAQLYATRSNASWGIGDLADLRRLGRWSAELGAGMLVVNPLGAAHPATPPQSSPYLPSSRRFRNPLYLRVEDVPGAATVDLARLSAEGRALNAVTRIDRGRVVRLKLDALARIWTAWPGDRRFEAFRREQGPALRRWATVCELTELHGVGWRNWPEPLRRRGPHAERAAAQNADRVTFHEWLQWLLDEQLAAAATELPLVQDVPVGIDPDGFDAWDWQDQLALEASIGAPPDRFNTRGQDWGLPPFVPHRLRETGYQPFIESLRGSLRHSAGLRIDHILGLFRLWWVPRSARSPAEGAYVRYPADELLEIVALESHRAGALVIGEDLGTVESGVRRELRRRRILSYRVVWFERVSAARYPRAALAAITTHDLPTIAGAWSGSDLADQERLDLRPGRRDLERTLDRLAGFARVDRNAPLDEVIVEAHRALGATPSLLVTATLDDALAVSQRPNMPGTIDEWPNWSIPLPVPLEEVERHPLVARVARAIAEGR